MSTQFDFSIGIPRQYLVRAAAAWICVVLCGGAVAAADPVAVQASAYDVSVEIDPVTHGLKGEATLTLKRTSSGAAVDGAVRVAFRLNKALRVSNVVGAGASVERHEVRESATDADAGDAEKEELLATHEVVLGSVGEEFKLTFSYHGKLEQDVEAGERPGHIHNFLMAAHVGPKGVFLSANGGWYPTPASAERALATYELSVAPVEGMEMVAGAAFDAAESKKTGRLVWRSRYPMDGLALVGGAHQVKERKAGDVQLALHYTPPEDAEARAMIERHTDMFLASAGEYLEKYQPLVGPYPFESFTIVENFFSSGFAFPEFTLLNRRLFAMGPRALMHGYLDHEMLHSWWGNSIYVDPDDGNWCESLASYGANYYGYVLDEDEAGARRYRRNACITFSGLEPGDDLPLGTFGAEGGAGRDIGYSKGAMMFHMLAGKIGQDEFWAAVRRLTAEYAGKYADWATLQKLFEKESGEKLDRFFEEWVRGKGAPRLEVRSAVWREDKRELEMVIDQGGTGFELAVPVRLGYADGVAVDKVVKVDEAVATVKLGLEGPPKTVVVDPDFQILRRLGPTEIMPTSRMTLGAERLLVVKPAAEVSPFYERLVVRFRG